MRLFLIILSAMIMLAMPFKAQAFGFDWLKNLRIGFSSNDEYIKNFSGAKTALNNLINAYESKNLTRLMEYVSEDYTIDRSILEDTVREEFSQHAFIEVRHYVDKVLFEDKNDKVLITVTYVKRVQDRSTADFKVTNGTSDLIFQKEDGKYKLWKIQPKFMGKYN